MVSVSDLPEETVLANSSVLVNPSDHRHRFYLRHHPLVSEFPTDHLDSAKLSVSAFRSDHQDLAKLLDLEKLSAKPSVSKSLTLLPHSDIPCELSPQKFPDNKNALTPTTSNTFLNIKRPPYKTGLKL